MKLPPYISEEIFASTERCYLYSIIAILVTDPFAMKLDQVQTSLKVADILGINLYKDGLDQSDLNMIGNSVNDIIISIRTELLESNEP
jgi:hypothetical protein